MSTSVLALKPHPLFTLPLAALILTACAPVPDGEIDKAVSDIFAGRPGTLVELKRESRKGIDTENLDLLPEIEEEEEEEEDNSPSVVPDIASMSGTVEFELFNLQSGRYYRYAASRAELARYSRARSRLPNESDARGEPVSADDLRREERQQKSWSNATDNRTRRAIADGWSDTNSIYQRLADYGGCSATVLSASSTRMIAITAAHCIFTAGNNFSNSKLRPRRNGTTSPTWGSWTPYSFAYYSSFLDNDCEDNWKSRCIRRDIALVFASPDSGATPPQNMGWGYRPKSFLDDHTKYRRGYPGCSNSHSPSGCTTNNLYGDGAMSVGSFSKKSNGWHRQVRFSSDINPGDSGSGLYYYRNGFPYVFGVTSAEPSGCKTSCSSSRPNYGRLITPDFFDFINSVM
ncbi:MAG: hypothetical protein AAF640_07250 [Pseudomonadota bacterium]